MNWGWKLDDGDWRLGLGQYFNEADVLLLKQNESDGKSLLQEAKRGTKIDENEAWMAGHDDSIGGKPPKAGTRKLPNHMA